MNYGTIRMICIGTLILSFVVLCVAISMLINTNKNLKDATITAEKKAYELKQKKNSTITAVICSILIFISLVIMYFIQNK